MKIRFVFVSRVKVLKKLRCSTDFTAVFFTLVTFFVRISLKSHNLNQIHSFVSCLGGIVIIG